MDDPNRDYFGEERFYHDRDKIGTSRSMPPPRRPHRGLVTILFAIIGVLLIVVIVMGVVMAHSTTASTTIASTGAVSPPTVVSKPVPLAPTPTPTPACPPTQSVLENVVQSSGTESIAMWVPKGYFLLAIGVTKTENGFYNYSPNFIKAWAENTYVEADVTNGLYGLVKDAFLQQEVLYQTYTIFYSKEENVASVDLPDGIVVRCTS